MENKIGKKRFKLLITLNSIILLFFLSLLYLIFYLLIGVLSFIIMPFILILIILIYECYVRCFNRYYIKKIEQDEFNELKRRKLIHYTNKISDNDYLDFLNFGKIKLSGTSSARSNYVMRFRDRKKSFIWFHPEDYQNKNEPELKSFLFSHLSESLPRKYKIIINPSDLDHDKIYIRPDNGNIIILGELEVPAVIESTFHWYNDKFYLKEIVLPSLSLFFPISYLFYSTHMTIGYIMDKFTDNNAKNTLVKWIHNYLVIKKD